MSSAFQALPMYDSKSVNVESVIIVGELPIMRSTRKVSEGIRHWFHLPDISFEEMEMNVLVLVACDVPEAQWILQHRSCGRKSSCFHGNLMG